MDASRGPKSSYVFIHETENCFTKCVASSGIPFFARAEAEEKWKGYEVCKTDPPGILV